MIKHVELRRHTARVAIVATVVVLACYVIAALFLNLFVLHRLTSNLDAHLTDQLSDVSRGALTPSAIAITVPYDKDSDDVPTYFWNISESGGVVALTRGAPALPSQSWQHTPETIVLDHISYRLDSFAAHEKLLVAGESISSITAVREALYFPQLVFGCLLAVVTFVGSLFIGLRSSAPSELIRRRQAEFTADASHELRTPLSVIEAEVELALRYTRDPATYEGVLKRVAQENLRLRSIVEDLLWLARADNGATESSRIATADVFDEAAASVERFRAVAKARGVELLMKRDGNGPFAVHIAPDALDRLIGVLIDNATKFAGPQGHVEVRVLSDGSRVSLRVDDSGPGIDEAHRESVFDRFHRATESVSGTGLGLAIADSVVRRSHGSWTIGTSVWGGARMEVTWRRLSGRVVPRRNS